MKRREFLKLSIAAAAFLSVPIVSKADEVPEIVVIGGGFSGATCAKYLRLWGGTSVNVTVIDQNPVYFSPILSNLVLNNQKSVDDLSFTYEGLMKYGIKIVSKKVTGIDSDNKKIKLDDNSEISYDKLVLAPGVDFKYVNSYDINKIPHAWTSAAQIETLKNMIDSMQNGDTFVMSVPKMPYRCPPAPYERVCVLADYLDNKGISANIVVLDSNPDVIIETDVFKNKFNEYGIDYRPGCEITYVDDTAMVVKYNSGGNENEISAKVINIIPDQKAGDAVFLAGVNDGDFAPVDTKSYESLIKEDIYVIGDAQMSSQPKAGHIGNSEAKICADAVLRTLNGYELYSDPKTNSTCYTPLSGSVASWLSAMYEYNPETKDMVLMEGYPVAGAPSELNYKSMFNWAGNLFSDTFS